MEFIDGIREGDGTHIICCWRFFLPLFRAFEHTNYGIETVNLLDQHDFLFTPRMKQQLGGNTLLIHMVNLKRTFRAIYTWNT